MLNKGFWQLLLVVACMSVTQVNAQTKGMGYEMTSLPSNPAEQVSKPPTDVFKAPCNSSACATPIAMPLTLGVTTCMTQCNDDASASGPGPDFNPPGQSDCYDFTNETVWFQITTPAATATLDIQITGTDLSDPYYAIFATANCVNYTLYDCNVGSAFSANFTSNVPAGTTLLIAVSDYSGDMGDFQLCVTPEIDQSACNIASEIVVTNTSMGSPAGGPYLPNEIVSFCYYIDTFDQQGCNWLQGVVPTFGNCWDPTYFQVSGEPNNSTGIAAQGSFYASGAWNWWPSGSVTYNNLNNPLIPNGANVGAGWFFSSNGFGDPDNSWGDGNGMGLMGSCEGPNSGLSWSVCFDLRATTDCANFIDCSVSFKTYGDGEIGNWTQAGCMIDQPDVMAAGIYCCLMTVDAGLNQTVCAGSSTNLAGSYANNDGATTVVWTSVPAGAVADLSNPNILNPVYTPSGTGVVTFTLTATDQTCTMSDIVTITTVPLPTISGNVPICVGGTVQLTGTPTAAAVTPWVSSNPAVATVGITGLVTGVSAGTTTITYTNSNGCQASVVVTVNPLPTISGNAPICVGATVQLTGSPTAAAVTPWVSSNPGVATVSGTGLVTGVSGGTTTITYTNTNGCQASVVVTVNPLPTISGNAPICIGTTVQLTGSATPAVVNPWVSSNPGVATVSGTGLVTGVSAGSTTITYTNTNGCQNTVIVTVNPLPTISGNAPICIGATVQLTGSATPAVVNPWVSSNPGVATVSGTGLVTGIAAGSATITYTNTNGCQNTVIVTVNPLPTISGNAPICVGATVQLTGSATPAVVNPWVSSNPGVATVSGTGLVTGVSAGSTTITYTNTNGCQNTVIVTVNPLPTISGNAPICVGATVQLTGSPVPAAVNPWVSSNPGVATVSGTGLVTGVSAGSTTITYTNTNGCQASVVVTVNPLPTISGNAPICVGATVQLTGSATPAVVNPWVSSNPGVATVSGTGLVTGVSAGSTTITYTNTNGCQNTVIVTVNPLPTISGNAPICIGATVQLTGSATPAVVNPWVSSNPGVATVSGTGLVTGIAAGSATITYTNTNGCQNTVIVTVNPLPTISGNAPICVGATVQLTGSATPAVVNPWVSSNPGVATVSGTGLVTGVSAGSTTITYTNTNGCQATVIVTVNPLPTISGNAPICVGATVQLTGSATPAAVTPWVSSNPGVATVGPTGLVTGVSAGSSTITYTNTNGCQTTVLVTVNPLPTIVTSQTPLTGCNSNDGIITVTGVGTGTVTWSGPSNGSAPGVTLPYNIVGLLPGTYDVTFTNNATGCTSTISQQTFANPGAPVINAMADYTACGGTFTLLNANITGTGLTGGQAYYTATGGPSGVGVLIPNGTVYSAPTSITIYAYDENGACSSEEVFIVTIYSNPTISGNAPICVGGTVQLTGTGTPNASTPWSSSNPAVATVSNTGLVTGVSGGSTTITYTDINGCQNTVVVSVNPSPSISGNTPICVSATVQLTGTGTPAVVNPWVSSNPGVATVSGTGLVTGVSAGTTTITYTDNAGCQATTIITVNALPTISGNAPICIGATVQLTGSATPNAVNPWVSSNPGVATVSGTGLVTAVSAGSTTITYTNSNGCQATVVVTVNALPTISGNAPICIGATVQLTGSATPAAVTPWVSSNPAVATVSGTGLVTGVAAGSTTITYTNTNGCQNTVIVTVNPLPTISGNAPICVGATVQLTGSATPAAVTPWVSSNPGVATVSGTGLVTGVSAGSTTITYTNSNGCQITAVVTVNALPTISGNAPICIGATVQLTGSATPAAVTPWASSNPGVATVSGTGLVTGVAAGSATITYTNTNGCQTTVVVTVNPLPTISGNAPICVGATVQLTGSAVPAAVTPWVSSNPGVATVSGTGLVTGVSAGSTTITYTNSNGCQVTTVVTVNPLPTISGNAPICVGATVQLTGSATPAAVTPWVSSNPGVATVSGTGLVTGVSAGSTTITYTNSNGCQITAVVTVNPLPTISGNAPICIGATVQLTGSASPAAVTPWVSSNPAVATVSGTGLVTGVSAGSTTITYTNSNGCQTTAVVTVNPVPTISGNAPICVGATVQLTGSATPAAVTPWVSSNPAVATVSGTGLVTGVSAGSTTITYTNSNGCQTTVVVTVSPDPTISGNSPLCIGETNQLAGSGTPNASTPWISSNNGVATVSATGLVTAVAAGTTDITYINSGGCQTMVTVTVNPAPVISTSQTPLTACSSNDGIITVSDVGGATGTITWSGTASGTVNSTTLPFDITGLAPGTYDVQFTDDATGCTSTISQEIFTNPNAPNVNDISDPEVCDQYTLQPITGSNLSGSQSYWTGTGGTGTEFPAGSVITTSMTLYLYDINGTCADQDTIVITVIPTPQIDPVSDVSACDVYALPAITGMNLSGGQAYYDDSQAGGGTAITGNITTSQLVYIYDQANGCENEISFMVTINPSPNVTNISGGAEYCVGDPVADILVEVDGSASWTVFYTLDGVAQFATGSSSPISLGNAAGVYVLTAVSDANCSNTATGTQTIIIHNYPTSPFAGTDANYCSTVEFDPMTASGSGGTMTWYNDPAMTSSLGTGNTFVPANVLGVTTYYVTETANGCEGPPSQVIITVEDCEVVIPTAFTPDGDSKNDFWEIINLDIAYPDNEVFVYNRWGNMLYTSTKGDYAGKPWDGTYNNESLPVGSYYFIVNYNDSEGTTETGTVSIILND